MKLRCPRCGEVIHQCKEHRKTRPKQKIEISPALEEFLYLTSPKFDEALTFEEDLCLYTIPKTKTQ